MKKAIDKAKLENVEWFSRFTILERIRIARKNLQRTRRLRGLALKQGIPIVFEECYKKAVSLKDPTGFIVHVPSIDDLIALKACKKTLSAKDAEDIEYLKIIKEKLKRGK